MDYFAIRLSKNATDRKRTWRALSKYLSRFIPIESTVLELAAGECLFINNIAAKNKFAIDIDEKINSFNNPDVITMVGNVLDTHNLERLNNGIDVVFASNFLEHLSLTECQSLLKIILKVLNKNGILILMQPNYRFAYKNYWDDFTHKTAFSHTSLTELLIFEGFEIRKCYRKFMPLTLNSRLSFLSFLVPIYLYLPIKPMAKQMLIIAKKSDSIKF